MPRYGRPSSRGGGRCFRCGRTSHYSNQCFAKTTVFRAQPAKRTKATPPPPQPSISYTTECGHTVKMALVVATGGKYEGQLRAHITGPRTGPKGKCIFAKDAAGARPLVEKYLRAGGGDAGNLALSDASKVSSSSGNAIFLDDFDPDEDEMEAAFAAAEAKAEAADIEGDHEAPESDEVFCMCRKEDDGCEMIGCDSDECAVGWYHLACLGLKKVPKGQWFCPNCAKAAEKAAEKPKAAKKAAEKPKGKKAVVKAVEKPEGKKRKA